MKITKISIIFALLFWCLSFSYFLETIEVNAMTEIMIRYNNALNHAVDDAMDAIVELDSGSEMLVNKEMAVESFYHSLYANFGIQDDVTAQEQIKLYVPVIFITDQDGYYIYHSTIRENLDGEGLAWEWTEKRPYVKEIDGNIYCFTMNDFVTYYDVKTGKIVEGYYQEIAKAFPDNTFLSDKERFEAERRFSIVDTIRKDLKIFVNEHNQIAKRYGITYQFFLPYIDNSDWYRTIDDVSFLAIFQGYPYKSIGQLGRFNKYAFAGARIKKSDWFYITEKKEIRHYHKSNCEEVTFYKTNEIYPTKQEAALTYAFPCQICRP